MEKVWSIDVGYCIDPMYYTVCSNIERWSLINFLGTNGCCHKESKTILRQVEKVDKK
jgi:hypothetical protein